MRSARLFRSKWLTAFDVLAGLGLFLGIMYAFDGSFLGRDDPGARSMFILVLMSSILLNADFLPSRPGWSVKRAILAAIALATVASIAVLLFGTLEVVSWRALLLVLLLLVWNVFTALNGIRVRILLAEREHRVAAQKALSSR